MEEEAWPEVRAYILLASDQDLRGDVSSLIGEPDEVHEKGTPILTVNPNRTYKQNFYLYGQLERVRCLDVPALVEGLTAKIKGKGADLVALGVETQLTIVVNYVGDQAPILSFSPAVLAVLHSAHASIDIDTYP